MCVVLQVCCVTGVLCYRCVVLHVACAVLQVCYITVTRAVLQVKDVMRDVAGDLRPTNLERTLLTWCQTHTAG